MTRTCIRIELPERYNKRERKLGRSKTAIYREEGDNWFFITDIFKGDK